MRWKPGDVTLYVPCYNTGPGLQQCLAGIDAQTVAPREFLLIDDGSVPSLEVDGRRIIRHAANAGLAAARNTALCACKTPLLAALDADVVPDPDWLQQMLLGLGRAEADGIGGRMDEHFTATLGDRWRAAHMAQHWGGRARMNPRFLYGANTLFRTAALRDAGGYDPELRTNNEDRTICEAIYDHGGRLYYHPRARCRHWRRDTCASILPGYWRWHYTAGLKQGDFDHPAGMLGRISLVNFGIYRYRADLDRRAGRPELQALNAALPWIFCAMDLWFYSHRSGVSLSGFPPAKSRQRLPEHIRRIMMKLLAEVPVPDRGGRPAFWADDYHAAFEECLDRFAWWNEGAQGPGWDVLAAELPAGGL